MTEVNEMEEQQEPGMGTLFLKTLGKGYDNISSTLKESTIPKFKIFVRNVFIALAAVFAGSLLLVVLGTTLEKNMLTVIGRFGLIFTGVSLFLVAAPVGYVFAGRKYMTFIRSFAIYQLFITLVILLSPMPVSLSFLFSLSFATSLLAIVNSMESKPGIIMVGTTVIFAFLLATIYFPTVRDKVDFWVIAKNDPNLIQVSSGDLKAGKVKFFLKGEPIIWYYVPPEGGYELFDHSGNHDIYQGKLKPITPEIARILTNNEKLLSPRNLQSSYTGTPAPASAPAPMTATLPPAPGLTDQELANFNNHNTAPVPAPAINPGNTNNPAPQNSHKEFAVVAIDERHNQSRYLEERLVNSLGANRAIHTYDNQGNIRIGNGGLDANNRQRLSRMATKIVYLTYQTSFTRRGTLNNCTASVSVKIIDAASGNILRQINKTTSAENGDAVTGAKVALSNALQDTESQLRQNL